MPDLNDFYAFKMTSSSTRSVGGRNYNSNNGNGSGMGCSNAAIVICVIFVLYLIGKFSGWYFYAKSECVI